MAEGLSSVPDTVVKQKVDRGYPLGNNTGLTTLRSLAPSNAKFSCSGYQKVSNWGPAHGCEEAQFVTSGVENQGKASF